MPLCTATTTSYSIPHRSARAHFSTVVQSNATSISIKKLFLFSFSPSLPWRNLVFYKTATGKKWIIIAENTKIQTIRCCLARYELSKPHHCCLFLGLQKEIEPRKPLFGCCCCSGSSDVGVGKELLSQYHDSKASVTALLRSRRRRPCWIEEMAPQISPLSLDLQIGKAPRVATE